MRPRIAVAPLFEPCSGEVGRALVTEGSLGSAMFIIESGVAEIRSRYFAELLAADADDASTTSDAAAGAAGAADGAAVAKRPPRPPVRGALASGDSFGEEVALGVSAEYRATVSATEPCELYLSEKVRNETARDETRRDEPRRDETR